MNKILLYCLSALAAATATGTENLYPNGGFEAWDAAQNLPTGDAKLWSRGKFTLFERSDREAFAGKYSLHLKDDDAGKSNSVFSFTPPPAVRKSLTGKVVEFSAQVKAVARSPKARVGIALWLQTADEKPVAIRREIEQADIGKWKKLSLRHKIPETVTGLRLWLTCSDGFENTGEAWFDEVSLRIVTREAAEEEEPIAAPPLPPLAEAPGRLTPEQEKYRESYARKAVFTDDGYARPAIADGTWRMNGRPEFLVGGWLYGPRTTYNRDWPEKQPNPQGIDHYAYREAPSKSLFNRLGFNSSQIVATAIPGAFLYGLKEQKGAEEDEAYWPRYMKRFDGVPLTLEFSFGFKAQLKKELPEIEREINQKNGHWHSFIPYCPEDPRGDAYYRSFMRGGTILALKNKANIFNWELFNESSYNCQCVFNRSRFAAEMKIKYGSIVAVNRAWDTIFAGFNELAASGNYEQYPKLWPDWCKFSARRYVEILQKYRDGILEIDKRPNIRFSEQTHNHNLYKRTGAGMDYRLIVEALDLPAIEGGWSYGDAGKRREGQNEEAVVLAANSRYSFVADLFAALAKGKKPVANHEHYCGRFENSERVPSRRTDIISSLWNEIMHGTSTVYVYAWDKRSSEWGNPAEAKTNALGAGYKGYSYLNPYNWPPSELDGFKLFRAELEPYREKVLPFPRFKAPTVAVFYSYPSLRMDGIGDIEKSGSFEHKTIGCHSRLKFAHYPLTFVFEEELEQGLPDHIQALILPHATFAEARTLPAVERFIRRGGLVIADRNALARDERGNPVAGLKGKHFRVDMAQTAGQDEMLAILEKNSIRRYFDLREPEFTRCDMQLIDRGDFKLLFLLNWGERGSTLPGTLTLRLDDAGEFYLHDPVNKRLFANSGKETWTMAELQKGVKIPVPPQERLLLVLERTRPAGTETVAPGDFNALLQKIQAKEAPEVARLTQLKAKTEQKYAAGRRHEGVKIANCRPLDLSRAANMAFKDEVPDDCKGGWFDQGENDFAAMPLGNQVLAGVPFTILDPAQNGNRGAVLLYGGFRPYFPKEAGGIPVGLPASRLYFLHAAAAAGNNAPNAVYRIRVNYSDGSKVEIPVRAGHEIGDWHGSRPLPEAKIALEVPSPHSGSGVINLQCFRWSNPHPGKEIATLDLLSAESSAVPAIVAITLEQ